MTTRIKPVRDWPRNKVLAGVAVIGAILLVAGYLTADQWVGVVTGVMGGLLP